MRVKFEENQEARRTGIEHSPYDACEMNASIGPWAAQQDALCLTFLVVESLPKRPAPLVWMTLEINRIVLKAKSVLRLEKRHMLLGRQHRRREEKIHINAGNARKAGVTGFRPVSKLPNCC